MGRACNRHGRDGEMHTKLWLEYLNNRWGMGVEQIHVVHYSDQWWAPVNTVMNLQVPLRAGNSLII
jgi:hypothetical protein